MTIVRRIVTAENESEQSYFAIDEVVEPAESHIKHYAVWGWNELPTLPPREGAQFKPTDPFPPLDAPHGVRVSVAEFRPDSDPLNVRNPEDEVGRKLTGGRMRERDLESGMHRTDSIDIVFVLEGEIVLEQDGGTEVTLKRGDCLVQNGARHNWSNRTDSPALVAFVIVAADRE